MKKLLLVLFAVMMLMSTGFVLADMSAPTSIAYTAFISNPNGVTYTDYTGKEIGTVPFGTKIVCYYNWDDKVAFVLENEKFEGSNPRLINLSDITIEDLSEYELGKKEDAFALDHAKIYSRPQMTEKDDGVKELISIPDETPIVVQEYKPAKDSGLFDAWTRWYYTSYQGVNGWIHVESIGHKITSTSSMYALKNILLKGENSQTVIPMYTAIKEYYGFGGDVWGKIYLEYNGVKGYLTTGDFANKVDQNLQGVRAEYEIPFEGVDLYEQASLLSPITIENLPVGTKLTAEYVTDYDEWIGVTYQGTQGWIYVSSDQAFEGKERLDSILASNKEGNQKYGNQLPTTVEEYSKSYFERLDNFKKVIQDSETIVTNKEIEENPSKITTSESIETSITPQVTPKEETKDSQTTTEPVEEKTEEKIANVAPEFEQKMLTPMQLILLCVLCAFVCGVTAAVIIVLVNKKNK